MDDPVKGEGQMITDANGITRREGGFQEYGAICLMGAMG